MDMKTETKTEENAPVTPSPKLEAVRELLRQWREEGDPQEQRETLEYLMRVLDEDRFSTRKLFP